MSSIDHILLFSTLFFWGYRLTSCNQQNINRHFWAYTSAFIIVYSLILGCRYGWSNDYLVYKSRYEDPYSLEVESLGFQQLNLFLNGLGFNYVGAFITYSFIYIVCAFILIKSFRENKYMLFFFLPATILQSTATIRQSLAHSFIFIALLDLKKKRWFRLIIFVLITYTIHPGASLLILLPIVFYFLKNDVLPLKYTIPIYLIASVFNELFSASISSFFQNILPSISLESKYNDYLQDDRWYGEDAINQEWRLGFVSLASSMFYHICIIYLGYIALKQKKSNFITIMYNTSVIGFILLRFFWYFEIFRRIVQPFSILYFIPLGYAFYIVKYYRSDYLTTNKTKLKYACLGVLLYIILFYGKFILLYPRSNFVWN